MYEFCPQSASDTSNLNVVVMKFVRNLYVSVCVCVCVSMCACVEGAGKGKCVWVWGLRCMHRWCWRGVPVSYKNGAYFVQISSSKCLRYRPFECGCYELYTKLVRIWYERRTNFERSLNNSHKYAAFLCRVGRKSTPAGPPHLQIRKPKDNQT